MVSPPAGHPNQTPEAVSANEVDKKYFFSYPTLLFEKKKAKYHPCEEKEKKKEKEKEKEKEHKEKEKEHPILFFEV